MPKPVNPETTAEAPKDVAKDTAKKEPLTTRVSRAIGLRGSDKKGTAKEGPDAEPAPGVRQIDMNVRTVNAAPAPNTTGSLLNGAQPIPGPSSFDNRWTGFR
jgi:hypothetical protein